MYKRNAGKKLCAIWRESFPIEIEILMALTVDTLCKVLVKEKFLVYTCNGYPFHRDTDT